jgi:hypothetical protein
VVDSEKMGGQGGDHKTANQSIVLAYSGLMRMRGARLRPLGSHADTYYTATSCEYMATCN